MRVFFDRRRDELFREVAFLTVLFFVALRDRCLLSDTRASPRRDGLVPEELPSELLFLPDLDAARLVPEDFLFVLPRFVLLEFEGPDLPDLPDLEDPDFDWLRLPVELRLDGRRSGRPPPVDVLSPSTRRINCFTS